MAPEAADPALAGRRPAGRRRRAVRREVLAGSTDWRHRRQRLSGRSASTKPDDRQATRSGAGRGCTARRVAEARPGCSPEGWGEANARAGSRCEANSRGRIVEVMRAGAGLARVAAQLTHGRLQGRGAGLRQQLRGCKPSVDIKEKGGGGRRRPARKIGRAAGAGSGPAPVCVAEAHQAAKESLGQGRVARLGRLCPLSEASLWQVAHAYGTRAARRRPDRVGSPLFGGPSPGCAVEVAPGGEGVAR